MHHYQNKEIKILEDGTKVVRKVHIKGKKGIKVCQIINIINMYLL